MSVRYGASRAEWEAFSQLLLQDLLPWVADPNVPIHPTSSLQSTQDKTPSFIVSDSRGTGAIGMPGWPDRRTTSVEDWAADPRLGICLQMRTIRAIDIDVPDLELAREIEGFVREELGIDGMLLPLRDREKSGKRALFYRLEEGDHPYQHVLIGDGDGAIEFKSGRGHQMAVAGMHPSGVYYRWPDGIPKSLSDIPALSAERVIALYDALWQTYGPKGHYKAWKYTDNSGISRERRVNQHAEDPVVQYLLAHDLVKGYSEHNGIYVRCPWESMHGSETRDDAAEYFPKGANGHETPGFHCFHAHSRGGLPYTPTWVEFHEAIGYRALEVSSEFEAVPASEAPVAKQERPKFSFKGRSSVIEANLLNITAMLRWSEGGGFHVRYDSFKDAIVYREQGDSQWRSLDDDTYTAIRIAFAQRGMETPSHESIARCVSYVARQQAIDSAQEWLNAQQWDGVRRIENFHTRVLGLEDTPYNRAVCLYMWTALAGRILTPGCKADMVPILSGKQGLRKSSLVEALAPTIDEYVKVTLADRDDNLSRQLRGKLVAEWDELRGLNSRDGDALKGWVSQRKDDWVPKFKEFGTTLLRRFLLIGTANPKRYLNDPTGLRRWLPLAVTQPIDVDYVIRNRGALWAEARELWKTEFDRTGVTGILWEDAEALASEAQHNASIRDPWVDAVDSWFDSTEAVGPWTTLQILTQACSVPISQVNYGTQERLRRVMSFMNWDETDDGRWMPPFA